MYTNAGMLAMMTTANIVANGTLIKQHLAAAEEGKIRMDPGLFAELVRWEQDINAHMVNLAERLGHTNVRNSSMKL